MMGYISTSDKVKTSCADCAFIIQDGEKQIGCNAGRLEKFQEIPGLVQEEKNHFVIGRVCNLFRDIRWLTKQTETEYSALARIASNESATYCDILLVLDNDSTLDELRKSVQSLKLNQNKPNSIIALLATRNIQPMECKDIIQGIFGDEVQWGAEQIVSPDISHLTSIDYAVKRVSTNFYSVSLAGFEYPPHYFDALDHLINAQLRQIIMVLPDETGNGLLVNRGVHEMLHGNNGGNIINKILSQTEAAKCQNLVLKFQELSSLSSQL